MLALVADDREFLERHKGWLPHGLGGGDSGCWNRTGWPLVNESEGT